MNMKHTIIILGWFLIIVGAPTLQSEAQSLISEMETHDELSSFVSAIKKAGLEDRLSGPGPYTVFAPTNNSFDKAVGIRENSQSRLENFILNHIMTGWASTRNLKIMNRSSSLGGLRLKFEENGSMRVNSITIRNSDIETENGVIHIIEGALE